MGESRQKLSNKGPFIISIPFTVSLNCRTSVDDFKVRSQSLPVTEMSEISFETGDKCFAVSTYEK